MLKYLYAGRIGLGWAHDAISFAYHMFMHVWLHSYLCFSLLEKWFLSYLDTSLTPGYLSSFQTFSYRNLNKSLIARWINRESSWILDSWWINRAFLLCLCFIPRHLLDSCICRCCFSRHLPQQMAWHLSTPLSIENYWSFIYWLSWSGSHFLWSLSICPHLFTSQITLSHSKPLSQVFFKLFQGFLFTW